MTIVLKKAAFFVATLGLAVAILAISSPQQASAYSKAGDKGNGTGKCGSSRYTCINTAVYRNYWGYSVRVGVY